MKKVLYLIIFLVVVFLGDRLIAFVALKVIQQSKNQFVMMYEGKYPADVIVLGNSRADRNISTEKIQQITGKVCLNLGLGGNSVRVSEALLKDYFRRYGRPGIVLIELSHSMVEPNSIGEMRIFSYCSENIQALNRDIDPTYAAFQSVFKSLRFNDPSLFRLAVEAFVTPSSRLLNNKIPPEILNKWKSGGYVKHPIIEKNMAAITRICNYADSNNFQIKLLISPLWKDYKKSIVNFQEWKSALQKAAGSHRIYDLSDAFFDQPEFFNDEMHLNVEGAHRFAILMKNNRII